MSVPDPTINFRAKQSVKDALALAASRISGTEDGKAGVLAREFVMKGLAITATLELLNVVGLEEVLRRLSQPSPLCFLPHSTEEVRQSEVQAKQDSVTHQPEPALQRVTR